MNRTGKIKCHCLETTSFLAGRDEPSQSGTTLFPDEDLSVTVRVSCCWVGALFWFLSGLCMFLLQQKTDKAVHEFRSHFDSFEPQDQRQAFV